MVSIALFELKSACISLLDTEYEGSSKSMSVTVVESILRATEIVRVDMRRWTVFLVHVTRSPGG